LAVKWFAPTIALEYQQIGGDMFIGGEAPSTLLALAAATNGIAGFTRVDDTVLMITAMRTSHKIVAALN
jgi:hypothetical protein